MLGQAIDEQHPCLLAERGADQLVATFVERGDGWIAGLNRLFEEGDHDVEESALGVVQGGLVDEPGLPGDGVRAHPTTSTVIR